MKRRDLARLRDADMNPIPTCPFCNAEIAFRPGMTIGQKTVCPRCGETFTLSAIPPAGAVPAPPPAPDPASLRRSNRLVAGIVLGVMGLMAATGLTYALLTQGVRREHDKSLPRRTRRGSDGERLPVTPTAPSALT